MRTHVVAERRVRGRVGVQAGAPHHAVALPHLAVQRGAEARAPIPEHVVDRLVPDGGEIDLGQGRDEWRRPVRGRAEDEELGKPEDARCAVRRRRALLARGGARLYLKGDGSMLGKH